jgi:hypothetical protein
MWEDLRFPVAGINPPGAVSDPARNTSNGLLEFAANADNIVAIQVQMPHSWARTPIIPHVHWRKKTEGAGNVLWKLTYEFVNRGGTFTDTPAFLAVYETLGEADPVGHALVHLVSVFGEIPMTGMDISCMGILTLSRLPNDGTDSYDGIAQLLEFDIHYQVDSFGSILEGAKQGTVVDAALGYGYSVNQGQQTPSTTLPDLAPRPFPPES